jgi:hypothetical protein
MKGIKETQNETLPERVKAVKTYIKEELEIEEDLQIEGCWRQGKTIQG